MPGRIVHIEPVLKSTWWYPQQGLDISSYAPASGHLSIDPWDGVPAGTPFSDLGIWLVTAATGGTCAAHMALYDSDVNGLPGGKLGEITTAGIDFTSGSGTAKSSAITRANSGCITTAGSPVVNDLSSGLCTALDVGKTVTGTGIPASTVVTSVVPGNSFTMSNNATADGTATVTFTRPLATGRRLWKTYFWAGTASGAPAVNSEQTPRGGVTNLGWSAIVNTSVRSYTKSGVSTMPDPLTGYSQEQGDSARVLAKIG